MASSNGVDISGFARNLNYDGFKNAYLAAASSQGKSTSQSEMDSLWEVYNSSEPRNNSNSGSSSSSSEDGGLYKGGYVNPMEMQDFTDVVRSLGSKKGDVIEVSTIGEQIAGAMKGFFGEGGSVTGGTANVLSMGINTVTGGTVDILTKQKNLHNEINSELSISGKFSEDLRDQIVETLPEVARMGFGFEDLSSTVVGMMQDTGRLATFGADVLTKLPEVARAFTGDMGKLGEMMRDFEMVGISAEDALKSVEETGKSSLQIGLNARKTVEELDKNVGKLNSYGFAKGTEGMARMVQKSMEFRMNMNEAFKVADAVMDPDKAIDMAANLQAIGGAIGDFNDPLKLMYMATNNVEGLQDALIGVAGSLATYNQEQGRFEITGVNLRKAKAMADELGISYEELANGAIAAAERSSAATELLASGLDLSDEQSEFLTNISRMKDGRMMIDVSNMSDVFGDVKEIALSDLTENQKQILLENQEAFKELSTEDIARNQYTETQKMALNISEIGALLKIQFAKAVNPALRGVDKQIAKADEYIQEALGHREGTNNLGNEVDRIKSEAEKMSTDYLKDKGITKEEEPLRQPPPEEVVVRHEVSMSETNLDAFARYIAQQGNLGQGREYTNPNS